MAGPSVVQVTGYPPTSGSTIPFTFGTVPSVGNVLVAFCAYSQYQATRTIGTPSGWVKVDDQTSGMYSMATFTRVVQSGDSTGYTFTISSGGDNTAGALYEVTGASTTAPVNAFASSLFGSGNGNTCLTAAVTPSVVYCLPLAGCDYDDQFTALGSVSSGWTNDIADLGANHTILSAHGPVTTDTVTAVSNTWTLTGSSFEGLTEIVLIAPSAAAVAPPPPGMTRGISMWY